MCKANVIGLVGDAEYFELTPGEVIRGSGSLAKPSGMAGIATTIKWEEVRHVAS